jgi:hypothetical protein
MNRITRVATVCMVLGFAAGPVLAQSGGAPSAAARLAKLKAQRDAATKAAQAKKAATPTAAPTPAPTPTPTPINTILRPPPTATPTATPTTTPTTTPTATASTKASAAASSSAKPPGSATPAASGSAALPVLAPKDRTDTAAIALDLEALKKSRPDRRHAEILDLQQRWGNLLSDSRAAAELKQHAQRIAYLQRIRALAVKANDAKLVKDVDLLLTKEELRDANALNALRSGALPGGAP